MDESQIAEVGDESKTEVISGFIVFSIVFFVCIFVNVASCASKTGLRLQVLILML